MRSLFSSAMAGLLVCGLAGCKQSAPTPAPAASHEAREVVAEFMRPSVAPPAFKVAHQSPLSFSLVVKENATNDEVSSVIWQLRDAAHAHSFDKLKISQKAVDARNPNIAFYVYRGAKCANEKYAEGKPPCGPSDHSAGSYTFGGYRNKDWDSGQVVTADGKSKQLWNPDAPYSAK